MRRLPPQHVERHLTQLITLAPELTETLLASIDQPLKIQKCPITGRNYLCCDYNRDGDAFRSPWCNIYFPPLENGVLPSFAMRQLELQLNDAFDIYREL
jgi:capping protein beta